MNRTSLLDRVNVNTPCPADWDEMRGNERVRFCQHCQLNVHNLSALTRPTAEKFVRRARGRICIRYQQRPDGAKLMAEPLVQIRAGVRRASRLAAGAFSAALSLCATAAAQDTRTNERAPATTTAQTQPMIVPLEATIERPVAFGGMMVVVPEEPLVSAVKQGDRLAVQGLLATGSDVNVLDKGVDKTPLMEAVATNNLELVQLLLGAGAQVNARNEYGQTALMELGDEATPELVRTLVTAGARLNLRDKDGDGALLNLARWGKADTLRALLEAGAQVNARNNDGETALMLAAAAGESEKVKALLAAGADVNRRNKDGRTALKQAQENEHADVVGILLAYGANDEPETKDAP